MPRDEYRPFRRMTFPVGLLLACLTQHPAQAAEKMGMPDLSQVEQTCLPTSTANLIIWFGRHGYPKLIPAGATADERDLRAVHRIMQDTDARFDWGTRMDAVTLGIEKYIREAGYSGEVEYRGLGSAGVPFSSDWLQQNDADNKGFVLFLAYCHWDAQTLVASPALGAGHAVTLVSARPDLLLVHDLAHQDDETGRKILTPEPIAAGTWRDALGEQSAAGLMFLTGSLLEAPPDSRVLLIGAVSVTLDPADGGKISSSSASAVTDHGAMLGHGSGAPAPAATGTVSWWNRLLQSFF